MATTNTVVQEPSSIVYKGDLKAVVNELLTDGVSVEYANYVVNGVYSFRKAVVNNVCYFDTAKIFESHIRNISELTWEGFVSTKHLQVMKDMSVVCTGYWSVLGVQYSTPTSESDFKCVNLDSGTLGVDLDRTIKVITEISSYTWINTQVQFTAGDFPENTKLIAYFDGVRTEIGDVFDTDEFQLQACSLKLPYSFIPLDTETVRLTIENSVTLDVYCDTGTRTLQYVDICDGFNNVAVGFLDKFNRWAFLPVVNYVKENSNVKRDVYDVSNSYMDYSTVEFKNDRRDKYITIEKNKTIDIETGYLSDLDYLEFKEVIESPYHYLFVDNVRYNATLVNSSWSSNKISRDGLKSVKLSFNIQDEVI